jgi:hypothetical protein
MRSYSREDVQFHSDGYRPGKPAVNVKVYKDIRDAWKAFERDEAPDARFTPEWVEENVSDDALDSIFWMTCEFEYEYLEAYATSDEDAILPGASLSREGRSGGWVVVDNLPDLEEWDAVQLAKWRKFERVAREIADGIPLQMLSSIYLNDFEVWADEQEDASASNSEAPVDQALATN